MFNYKKNSSKNIPSDFTKKEYRQLKKWYGKTNPTTDIFSDKFKPYITYTKGFWAENYYTGKKEYIRGHYSYVDKNSVSTLNLNNPKDKELFEKLRSQKRIFSNKQIRKF